MSDAPIMNPVSEIADIESAGDFEKKHTPHVTLTSVDGVTVLSVKLGHWVAHPNTADHSFQWIEVFANDAPIARFDIAAVVTSPDISMVVSLDSGTQVRVVAFCNLHGLWARSVTV